MSFLLSVSQNFVIFLVVNMFKQVVEFTDAYSTSITIHSPEEYRVISTANNFYRITSAIRVYLSTLNQSEHVAIPSGKLNTQSILLPL